MAVKSGPAPTKSKAEPMDVMAFSFSDTIAGYVKRYDRNADTFAIETTDGREFTVALTDRPTPSSCATWASPTSTAPGRCATCSCPGRYLFTYGVFYPEAGKHVSRRST